MLESCAKPSSTADKHVSRDSETLSDMTFYTTHSPQNRGQCPSRLPEPQPSPTHRVPRPLSTSAQGVHFVTWGLACRPYWLAAMDLSYHSSHGITWAGGDLWRPPAPSSLCLIQHRAPQNSFSWAPAPLSAKHTVNLRVNHSLLAHHLHS